jgi:hypothetical protein
VSPRTGSAGLLLAALALAGGAAAAPMPALEVVLDRPEAYEGEQVTATLRVLSRAPLAGYHGTRAPRLEGFWVEEVARPTALAAEPLRAGGEVLRAYPVRRLALFPRGPGELVVAGAEAEVRVKDAAGARVVPLAAPPVAVRALPLPPGAPPGFDRGSVGAFALAVTADPPAPHAGEPFVVRIVAHGAGNLRALRLPALPHVPGTRALGQAIDDDPRPHGTRFAGARALATTLVADAPGRVEIPSLAWPTFDPAQRRYVTLRSEPLRLEVRPPAPHLPPAVGAEPAPIRRPERRLPVGALATAALALAVAALALRSLRRERPARRRRSADEDRARAHALVAMDDLARGNLGSAGALARALEAWSEARLRRPVEGLTRAGLTGALARAGVARPADVAAALDGCDVARFGGAPDPRALADGARAAIEALEE